MNVAVVLQHTKIHDLNREPGSFLNLEEYNKIPEEVRDSMESVGVIKKILDTEAVRIMEDMDARLAAVEKKLAALEN